MKLTPEFWAMVEACIDQRLAGLQQKTFAELISLPDVVDEGEEIIQNKTVVFNGFIWQNKPSSVLVVSQAATSSFLKFFLRTYEKGFVMSDRGDVREATSDEILGIL